jgi:hypothetical protein
LEATTGFEPVIEVLQTSALPLGYVALGAQEETRTLTPLGTAPSRPRVYLFHHLGINQNEPFAFLGKERQALKSLPAQRPV